MADEDFDFWQFRHAATVWENRLVAKRAFRAGKVFFMRDALPCVQARVRYVNYSA